MKVYDRKAVAPYKKIIHRIMPYLLPTIGEDELDRAINYSISKRFKNTKCSIHNNYKNKTFNTDLLSLIEYIIDRRPIITSFGVLFTRHGEVPNPLAKMIEDFYLTRKGYKNQMFEYPKGSDLFKKYNLLQMVAKVSLNA